MPVARTTLIEPVINVLAHVAGCAAPADALCVWESALRKGAVQPGVLTGVRWRGSAQQLAALASVLSDSGLETRFVVLMRGLGVEVRQQVWIDGHPVDGLIGERLVVQLDGFAHHQGADRRRDLRADARLVLLGYTVMLHTTATCPTQPPGQAKRMPRTQSSARPSTSSSHASSNARWCQAL